MEIYSYVSYKGPSLCYFTTFVDDNLLETRGIMEDQNGTVMT